MIVTTAQELFKVMLRDHVAPALREAGLKGSGTAYFVPSETHWALVGFQKSTSSDSSQVKFTVNLKVVRKDLWHEQRTRFTSGMPERPSPTLSYMFEWDKRIGFVLPEGQDHWWSLRVGDAPDGVAREVLEAVRAYGLPVLRQQIERTT